jgi:hypothetical protein
VLYHVIENWGLTMFGAAEWLETESADALTWWQRDLSDVMIKGKNGDFLSYFQYSGSWSIYNHGLLSGGECHRSGGQGGEKVSFEYFGKSASIFYLNTVGNSAIEVYLDGVLSSGFNTFSNLVAIGTEPIPVSRRGLHYVEVVVTSGELFFDYLQVY